MEAPAPWHNGSCCQPVLPAAMATIYGQQLGMPLNTVLIIAADKKTVLWNSSQPAAADLTAHKILPPPASAPALKFHTWTDNGSPRQVASSAQLTNYTFASSSNFFFTGSTNVQMYECTNVRMYDGRNV